MASLVFCVVTDTQLRTGRRYFTKQLQKQIAFNVAIAKRHMTITSYRY